MIPEVVIRQREDAPADDRFLSLTLDDRDVPVLTWADGYGVWHAAFEPLGDEALDAVVAISAIGYRLSERGVVDLDALNVSAVKRPENPTYRYYREEW